MPRVDIVVTTNGKQRADVTKAANGGQSAQMPIEALNQGTSGNSLIVSSIFANQLVNLGKQTLVSTFNFAKSKYGDFTGDYIGQTKIDNAFANAANMLSIGGSILSGAMSGAAYGPVGMGIGAAVGAVVSVGSLAVSSAQNQFNYAMSMNKQNANASFNSARLGAILVDGNRG